MAGFIGMMEDSVRRLVDGSGSGLKLGSGHCWGYNCGWEFQQEKNCNGGYEESASRHLIGAAEGKGREDGMGGAEEAEEGIVGLKWSL